MQGLFLRISALANLMSTWSSNNAYEAFKWYFTKLRLPTFPSPLCRGVSFLEFAFDFVASTDVSVIGANYSHS